MGVTTSRRVAEQSVTAYENLIGGNWRPASDGRTLDMISPSDGQAFARIARGTKADVDAAVRAARHAFEEGAWGKMTAVERGRLMTELGEAILANHEELSQLEARDCGKPMKQARADITAAARYFEFYGGAADKYHGDTIPFLDGYMVTILREPKGVTGHIIPWNYPAQMFGRSLAPALAMGNAVVMKPAEDACVTPVRLAQLAQAVGFPPGALNVVTGIGEEAGAALASHPGIDFLSFTGSPEVGTLVQKAAAQNHIGCTLELGGKSPQIVFEDADFDAAVPVLSIIAFEDEADAVKLANSTEFGLVAGIWTRDGARQMRVAKKMRCGQVFVNGYGAGGGIELPFGGVKKSGHGREKGMEALNEFSHTKTIVFKHG